MDFIKNILNKTGKDKILIVLLVGIIMLVISIPTTQTSVESTSGINSCESSADTTLEGRLIRCLSKVENVGEVDAVVTYESDGKTVSGVIIVAKGGDNATVAAQITEAVEALLGLGAHKIKVMKMA